MSRVDNTPHGKSKIFILFIKTESKYLHITSGIHIYGKSLIMLCDTKIGMSTHIVNIFSIIFTVITGIEAFNASQVKLSILLLIDIVNYQVFWSLKNLIVDILQLILEDIENKKVKNASPLQIVNGPNTLIVNAMIIYNYRMLSSEELRRRAIVQIDEKRKSYGTDASLILVPDIDGVFGTTFPVNNLSIAESVAGVEKTGLDDQKFSEEFYKHSQDHRLFLVPNLVPFKTLMNNRAPVLTFLRIDSERDDTWDYPSIEEVKRWGDFRGLSIDWMNSVGVKEFIIGVDGKMDMCDMGSWYVHNMERNKSTMPTGVVSLDVKYVPITYFDTLRISSRKYRGLELPLSKKLESSEDADLLDAGLFAGQTDAWLRIPAKIMIGGYDWCVVISFDIKEQDDESYTFNCQGIPEEIMDFLMDLPVVTGFNVHRNMLMIEEALGLIAGQPLTMQGCLEIETLAVLAGWQLCDRDQATMALLTLGSTMNLAMSNTDMIWGINWPIIPESLQTNALGDVKCGYLIYNVLIAVLLRQLFPDPDVVCKMSKCTQDVWATWFYHWIRDTLVGTVLSPEDTEKAAKTGGRKELMLSIKYRNRHAHVSDRAPARIRLIADLVCWPTLTQGGARYLHPVRQMYLSQYQVLKASTGIPGVEKFFIEDVSLIDTMYATFGHLDIAHLDCDMGVLRPADAEFWSSLLPHPSLTKPLLVLDGPITLANLHEAAANLDRGLYEAMLEWFRFDVDRLRLFFSACRQDEYLSKCHRGKYEDYRLLYIYVVNREPRGNPECDASICAEVQAAVAQEMDHLNLLMEDLKLQKSICAHLEQANSASVSVNRFAWKSLPKPVLKKPVARRPSVGRAHAGYGGGPGGPGGPGGSGNTKRGRSPSVSRLNRTPLPKKGRSQAERLEEMVDVLAELDVRPVVQFKEDDECVDGGRRVVPNPVPVEVPVDEFGLPPSPVLDVDLD